MISIVFVGRNDNYGGDFDARLMATTQHNIDALEARGVEYEIVFVEWNPFTDRPLLSEGVAARFERARCLVIDNPVHRHVTGNRHAPVLEYVGKNVGARRALGEQLLVTNPDNYLGQQVLDFLATGPIEPNTLYRAGRIDIDDESEVDSPHLEDEFSSDAPPYTSGSGDFVLVARAFFDRIGGFREDLGFTGTHKDSILCHTAWDLTAKARKIGNTFHIRHARDGESIRRPQYRWAAVDRTPQADYGLTDICVEEVVASRITRLALRPDLLADALRRELPEPHVPKSLRRRRDQWLRRTLKRARRKFSSK